MFILEEPYASPLLLEWLKTNRHPVLTNNFSQRLCEEGAELHLIDNREAKMRIAQNERVCTNSENALGWLAQHAPESPLARAIEACKDKELMRQRLRELDQKLFFQGCTRQELEALRYEDLPAHLIIKPAVGFCSLGVYAVHSQTDWDAALRSLAETIDVWGKLYPESVVGTQRFVVEQMVGGQEYAVDMFYDEEGSPHIFNIFQHDFAGPADTSDRLYWCSQELNQRLTPSLIPWLSQAGKLLRIRNFCVHIELRIENDQIHAIEFNPLRFAGLGGTDLSHYACGMLAYDAYLKGSQTPAFLSDDRYVMSVLMPASSTPKQARFDYEAFETRFSHVLELRRFDRKAMGAFGFLFMQTPEGEAGDAEMDYLLNVDLGEFIR